SCVLHRTERNLVLCGVDQLDVTNCVWRLFYLRGHAVVTLTTESYGPVHGRILSYFVFPLVADFGKIIGEHIGRAASVGSVDDADVIRRKLYALVASRYRRIIPLCDLSQEDSRQSFRSKVQRGCHTGNVVGGHNGSKNRREVQNAAAVLVAV